MDLRKINENFAGTDLRVVERVKILVRCSGSGGMRTRKYFVRKNTVCVYGKCACYFDFLNFLIDVFSPFYLQRSVFVGRERKRVLNVEKRAVFLRVREKLLFFNREIDSRKWGGTLKTPIYCGHTTLANSLEYESAIPPALLLLFRPEEKPGVTATLL